MFPLALVVFTIAGITDGLDGLLARYFNQKSVLGAYLDPIADKFLLISAYVSLAVLKIVPGWLTVIVLTRDIIILLAIAIFAITEIKIEIKPSFVSKCTTVAQLVTIILALLNPNIPGSELMKMSIFWITAALTIISGFHYIFIGMNLLQNALTNNPKKNNR
jgi:cardiolipin synthase